MLPPDRRGGLLDRLTLRAFRVASERARAIAANARCALSCAGENRRFALLVDRLAARTTRARRATLRFAPRRRRPAGGLIRKGIIGQSSVEESGQRLAFGANQRDSAIRLTEHLNVRDRLECIQIQYATLQVFF